MANNLSSNVMKLVTQSIAKGFESNRVTSKTVNTTNIQGKHTSRTGSVIYDKRKTSFRAQRTSGGDISGTAPNNDLLVGQIAYTVQNMITVDTEWTIIEEALQLDQLDQILMPMGEECADDLEKMINDYMIDYSGLTFGTPGTPISSWEDVAYAQAFLNEMGVPNKDLYYQMNSFSSAALNKIQVGINAPDMVKTAWQNAAVPTPIASMQALKSNAMRTYTTGACADRVGSLSASPDVTWATHKDTMIQTLSVENFTTAGVIAPGEVIEVTGRYHVNPRNGNIVYDETGAPMTFRWTVVTGVTLSSGAGDIEVTNAAIYDTASNRQYDNISSAPVSGDVITLLGNTATVYKPSLLYQKDAFSLATIQIPKLYDTDTVYTSKDGLKMRISKGADILSNKQILRVDLLPAMGVANPMHAARCFGRT